MSMINNALYDYLTVDLLPYENTGTVERQFAVAALKKSLLKKFQDTVDTKLTDAVAIDKFMAMNIRCDDWSYSPETLLDEMLYGAFEKRVHALFSGSEFDHSLEFYIERGRFGPGASVGANGYDFFTKIGSGPLTATSPGIYRAYDNYVSTIPYWRVAEIIRSLTYGDVNIVSGSVLQCVPKNDSTSRTICTEPALNMFAQLGLGSVIEDLLKTRYQIDLSTQPGINAELARIGSCTGDFFTIDLESASDTISLKMLERFMPKAALSLLKALRSPTTRLPSGELLELRMISSMGNGFTFPLQTALFACALAACYDVDDGRDFNPAAFASQYDCWGVFGDDIVGPTRLYNKMSRLLKLLGFIVNKQKSFNHGAFRESCGADYINGVNVRGVYIKSLKTQASRYVAINLLNRWSADHGVPLTHTLGYLIKKVRFLPVPLHESDDSGIKLPLTLIRERINIIKGDGGNFLYKYKKLINRPCEMRTLESGEVVSPKGSKRRISNPAALLTAFLGGYVRNGVIMLRQLDGARPGTRNGCTPHWDHIPDATTNPFVEPVSQQVLYRKLVTSSVLNFSHYLK